MTTVLVTDPIWDVDIGTTFTVTLKHLDGTLYDLTGLVVRLYLETGAGKVTGSPFAMTADPDQVTNRGVATWDAPASVFKAGQLRGQVRLVDGAKTFASEEFITPILSAVK